MTVVVIFVSLFLSAWAHADGFFCKNLPIDQAPLCPTKTTMLSEMYPVATLSISDKIGGSEWIRDFVRAALLSKNLPTIIVVGNRTGYDAALDEVKTYLGKLPAAQREQEAWKLKDLIIHSFAEGHNWQQDFYKGYFDPRTGRPVVRGVEAYFESQRLGDMMRSRPSISSVTVPLKTQCGIARGEDLKPGFMGGGHMGGNLDAAPGDLCLVGDAHFGANPRLKNDYDSYSLQACGNSESVMTPPTSFLMVGHTDEIYKLVPKPNAKGVCAFTIALATPAKAFELLAAEPGGAAFSFLPRFNGGPLDANEMFQRFSTYPPWRELCTRYVQTLPNAADDPNPCSSITNGNLLQMINDDPEFLAFNRKVDEKMKTFKQQLETRIHERLPSCKIDFVEMPILYYGNMVNDDEFVRSTGLAIWPPAVNSVYLDGRLIQPDPMNETFRKYIERQWQRRGVGVSNVDTFFGFKSDRGGGNVHCSTNVTRFCKPNSPRGNASSTFQR